MKTFINAIFFVLIPFTMAMAFILVFAFGLVIVFYLLLWGIIAGSALYVIAWIYRLLFAKRPPKRDFGVAPTQQRQGHTYDHNDL